MPPFAKTFAKAALALATLAAPAWADDWSSLLLDRTVNITVPDSFVAESAFSDATPGSAIIEFIPPGESLEAWSQMFSLTAFAGVAEGTASDQAVLGMAEQLAQGYAAACPGGMATEGLGSPALAGAEATFTVWLACDQVGDSGTAEAMVALILAIEGTIYTVQWAERGPATEGPPVFDFNHWLPRLDALMTISL